MMVDELKVVDVLQGVASSYAALDLYTRPPIISSASSFSLQLQLDLDTFC